MDVCPSTALNSDASENVLYNHPDFPASLKKGRLSGYPDFRAVSHWHDDWEWILILEGEMLYDVNGQTILLQAGEGIFVNSRCFHYGYSDTRQECLFLCILLSQKLFPANAYFAKGCLEPLLRNVQFPYQKLNPSVPWQKLMLQDLHLLWEGCSDTLQPFLVLEKAAHMLRLLVENMDGMQEQPENPEEIQSLTAMIGYVQKNYPNKILLKDISSAGSCCKTRCTMLFRKYLDTSPMLYLNSYRLEKAAFLLRNTAQSVTEIAYSCGFSNSSYFCELFHRYYHRTPGKFRSGDEGD